MSEFTEADLIQAVQRASKRQERPVSRSDFERISGISQHQVYRLFPDGGWSDGSSNVKQDPRCRASFMSFDNEHDSRVSQTRTPTPESTSVWA